MALNSGNRCDAVYALTAGVVLVCLVLGLMCAGLLQLVKALEPKLGEIIAFNDSGPTGVLMQERMIVRKLVDPVAKYCVLDPPIMRASGGSIVIEALQLRPQPIYTVHWAGFHTSAGTEDCGAEADLMLSRIQMVKMISEGNGPAVSSKYAYYGVQ